jgi:hypothetical protein
MPFDPLTRVEDISRVVQRFPALRDIRLHREGARLHLRTDSMAHKSAIDEAQCGMRVEADGKVWIEVCRVIPTHAGCRRACGDGGCEGWLRVITAIVTFLDGEVRIISPVRAQ